MELNQISLLDKDQLLMVIRENGYDDIADILKDKDITGQTFLDLPTFQLISWKLPAATVKIVSKFIENTKKNPSMLIKNRYLENTPQSSPVIPLRNLNTAKHSEINNIKDKLKIALSSEKSRYLQPLSPERHKKPISAEPNVLGLKSKLPKLLPPAPRVTEKVKSSKITTFLIDEPDELDFIPVTNNQDDYIVLREPVPLSKEVDLNLSNNISNRKPIPIPIDEDYIDMEMYNQIKSEHPINSNRTVDFPIPREESTRKGLPIQLEQLPVFSKEPIGEYIDSSQLKINDSVIPLQSFNKNENAKFNQTHQDPKSAGGIFESLGRIIKSKPRKGYENCEIEERNPNPTKLKSTTSYQNRPLPPIPRDEEITTNSQFNRIRIHKSYDDNLMNKNKDGKVTRRSVDFNNERFYRNTDRKGAERLLGPLKDGAFLFRPSKAYYLALTIKYKQKFYNFGIERTPNMKIRLNADTNQVAPEFRTLRDFSEHFTKEPIAFKNDTELIEILLEPVLPKNLS